MTRRLTFVLGECPRKGCIKEIVAEVRDDGAFVRLHKCAGKPYTTKENK